MKKKRKKKIKKRKQKQKETVTDWEDKKEITEETGKEKRYHEKEYDT